MSLMRDLINYCKMTAREFRRRPGLRIPIDSLKYFSAWRKFQDKERNSVDDQMPWMAFSAIVQLGKIIRPDMRIFEYGSGGSTLFWASRVKQVISIEHDRRWFERMRQELVHRRIDNVTYLLREAEDDPSFSKKDYRNPDDYVSSDSNYTGQHFEAYVKTLEEHPDGSFDVIVVDGRARPSCIKHAQAKLKKGGYLIVDNSERTHYLSPFSFHPEQWRVRTFGGPIPYLRHHSDTTFLMKRTDLSAKTPSR